MSSPTEPTQRISEDIPRRSKRACKDPRGNGTGEGTIPGYKGCTVCHNEDKYGFGSSVCGRCNRCHGCGSSNNGIGPIQAVYFGGKAVAKKTMASLGMNKDDNAPVEAKKEPISKD